MAGFKETMGHITHLSRGITACALLCASASVFAVAGSNPFAKTEEVNIGADIDWDITEDTISKAAASDDGSYYRLTLEQQRLVFHISNASARESHKSFSHLGITELAVDGERLPVFQWCLNNQDRHNRFLQQGLKVRDDVCVNDGQSGEFTVRLNRQTMEKIENGERLVISIRPFRTTIDINYDISDFKQAVAVRQVKNNKVETAAVVPVSATTLQAVEIKPAAVKMCEANAPQGFANIASVEYVCSDNADKSKAQRSINAAVAKEKQRRKQVTAEKEKKRLAAIAAKKKQEQERLRAEQEEQAEQAAIAASEEKHHQVMDALTEKMVGVCNKMWSKGKHRCYCEKFIQYAPADIKSDPSCSG